MTTALINDGTGYMGLHRDERTSGISPTIQDGKEKIENLTITKLLSMSDDECLEMLAEVKKLIKESSKSFYSPSNRTFRGKPRSGGEKHYSLQVIRDWLKLKLNGDIGTLKLIAESRKESNL